MKIDKTKVFIVIVIIFILLIVYLYKKKEEFEEDTTELDKVQILEKCKDMTPNKLFKLFREDVTYMTQVFVDNKVPIRVIKDPSYYPKIASLLVKNEIIKCA
jgi:hypothetical protein|uniref:Uncharacterized protein n=1 Tax=viral metagenome TaxID=1070528 RepID=A0A6C0AM33_9ZZZZ